MHPETHLWFIPGFYVTTFRVTHFDSEASASNLFKIFSYLSMEVCSMRTMGLIRMHVVSRRLVYSAYNELFLVKM